MNIPALIIVGAGIVASLHVGKIPTALPALQLEFGLSLVQASLMISGLQIAGGCMGIFGGAIADRFGHTRIMVLGLCLLASGSLLGAFSDSSPQLLVSRVLESLGFLFTVLPGPTLLRQRVPAAKMLTWLGWWGAYMPFGMGLGLLIVPMMGSWRAAWILASLVSFVWAVLIFAIARSRTLPGAMPQAESTLVGTSIIVGNNTGNNTSTALRSLSIFENARRTLSSGGPWLLSLSFGSYASQFMGVFGFLPTIYKQAGIGLGFSGALTTFAVLVNAWGNIEAGRLAQKGVPVHRIIIRSALMMIVAAWCVFAAPLDVLVDWCIGAPLVPNEGTGPVFWLRYACVVWFSAIAGRIPSSLFGLTNRFAPGPEVIATTVGFMQQGSAIGQLVAPVLIAWVATQTGGWSATWWVTSGFSMLVIIAATQIAKSPKRLLE